MYRDPREIPSKYVVKIVELLKKSISKAHCLTQKENLHIILAFYYKVFYCEGYHGIFCHNDMEVTLNNIYKVTFMLSVYMGVLNLETSKKPECKKFNHRKYFRLKRQELNSDEYPELIPVGYTDITIKKIYELASPYPVLKFMINLITPIYHEDFAVEYILFGVFYKERCHINVCDAPVEHLCVFIYNFIEDYKLLF